MILRGDSAGANRMAVYDLDTGEVILYANLIDSDTGLVRRYLNPPVSGGAVLVQIDEFRRFRVINAVDGREVCRCEAPHTGSTRYVAVLKQIAAIAPEEIAALVKAAALGEAV